MSITVPIPYSWSDRWSSLVVD